ncbi:hypothetical protein C8R44DRAFT_889368 [Mycena epipterygia]|nr:hypothetical protein C8R44DRAFT_889368 [Mycena epipterygia]
MRYAVRDFPFCELGLPERYYVLDCRDHLHVRGSERASCSACSDTCARDFFSGAWARLPNALGLRATSRFTSADPSAHSARCARCLVFMYGTVSCTVILVFLLSSSLATNPRNRS